MAEHHELIVVGSGPAGFTAGLYGSRANLEVVVFEGDQPGGQLMITTEVENYPGFPDGVMGPEMMEIFRKQAHRFGTKSIYETIEKVDFTQRPFQLWTTENKHYTADAVIISTGATAKRLHHKGEDEYWGLGISACATCDGFFFRNQKVFVIGGGDTAMEEANYLSNLCSSVTIIHRRQEFRASKIMVDRAEKNPKINYLLDSVVDEYIGIEENGIKRLSGVRVKNVKTGEITEHTADGAFIAIGHDPNTNFLKGILDMDENGYLITKGKSSNTNIPGVFACGDCQDHVYKQAVTAAGSGCMAAIDAERWLGENK